MFVCSVSTVVFNANPLLRYDGYYILADLAEIPNLRQKATTILSRKLGEWCLGLEQPEDPFLPQRNQVFFAIYSVASAIYRWVVVFSILWFLYKFSQPYHLEVIGQMIGIASLWGLVVMPLYQVGKFFYVPGRLDKVKKPRMFASLAVVAADRGGRCARPPAAQRDVDPGGPSPATPSRSMSTSPTAACSARSTSSRASA